MTTMIPERDPTRAVTDQSGAGDERVYGSRQNSSVSPTVVRMAWFWSRVRGCQPGSSRSLHQAWASLAELGDGQCGARASTFEPASHVCFRPEEVHRASGEHDVVPPARWPARGSGTASEGSSGRRSRTSQARGSPQSAQAVSIRPSVWRAAQIPKASQAQLAYHQRPAVVDTERGRHGGERVGHADLAGSRCPTRWRDRRAVVATSRGSR